MQFPFESDQLITLEDLLPLKPVYLRSEMEESIFQYIDDITEGRFDKETLRSIFSVSLEGADQLLGYVHHMSDEDLVAYFDWIHCYSNRYNYDQMINASYYEIKSEAIIRELFQHGFLCIGSGLGRKVFDLGNWVLKIPYTSRFGLYEDIGIVENNREVELYQHPHEDAPLMAPVISLRYQDESGYIHEGINLMEKLEIPSYSSPESQSMMAEVRRKYPEYTHWSFGYDTQGQLRVYDFD